MRREEETTIAAVATPLSEGGISIIRISGPGAFEIADRVYVSPKGKKKLSLQKSHTIHYGYIKDGGETIDEVLVSVMRAPKTYTAEDTVEINCHGGILVTKRVLETVFKNGAVPAEPGEFTKRAFLNGRIDLSRAEAVMDLISAKNDFALQSSVGHLQGRLEEEIKKLRSEILDMTARIEAALDDPEHLSLDGFEEEMCLRLKPIEERIRRFLDTFSNGRILSEGIRTVILGRPNVGKSSLLNLFSGYERAIVTDVAGTTRDTLEEQLTIGGIGFKMIDTAGLRKTDDPVEKIGVGRALKAAEEADLILWVMDASEILNEDDRKIEELPKGKKGIILLNKSDRQAAVTEEEIRKIRPDFPIIHISAKTGEGTDRFTELVTNMFLNGELHFNDEVILTNQRQKHCMEAAAQSIRLVAEQAGQGVSEDLLTIDLMDAYDSLGQIIGESTEDDLADRIFEKFCMGK